MTTISSSRTRTGALLVALALVGGTGCITMSFVDRAQQEQHARKLDEAYDRRIAQLTTPAQAGAPTAMRALAFALMAAPGSRHVDLPRVLSLLERAGKLGDVSAQVALAEMLASGFQPVGNSRQLPQGLADRRRGIALLQQAAPLACIIWVTGDPEGAAYGSRYNRDRPPTLLAARFLRQAGREDEARLWRARDVLHCGGYDVPALEREASNLAIPLPARRTALSMLMLGGDRERERVVRVTRDMAADDVAAAEREAADLRRRVADSEREFPAPTRKELQ